MVTFNNTPCTHFIPVSRGIRFLYLIGSVTVSQIQQPSSYLTPADNADKYHLQPYP